MSGLAEAFIHVSDWIWTTSFLSIFMIALIVLLQRTLKEKLIPGWSCLLWLLVLARLLIPWSPESRFSILNRFGHTSGETSSWQALPHSTAWLDAGAPKAGPFWLDHIWVSMWLAGVLFCAIYTLWGSWSFARRINRESTPVADPYMLQLFAQCQASMAVHRSVTLVESANWTTPALYGLAKPRVVIPAALLSTLSEEQLRHVLLHELAHVKRHDIALNWLMHMALSLHWFNPVLWYASGRLKQDQEMASDALALACLAPERRLYYGHTLINMLEHVSRPVRTAGNVNLTGSARQLKRRIQMIKKHKSHSRFMSLLAIAGILLVSGCVLTNPKESGDPATVEQSPSASTSTSATASPQASPSPSIAPEAANQPPTANNTAAPKPEPSAGQSTQNGTAQQPILRETSPVAPNTQREAAQVVPQPVPPAEQGANTQPAQLVAEPAPVPFVAASAPGEAAQGVSRPAAAAAPSAQTAQEEAPQLIARPVPAQQ